MGNNDGAGAVRERRGWETKQAALHEKMQMGANSTKRCSAERGGGGGGGGRGGGCTRYLVAAEESRGEHGLLGAYHLLPLLQLGAERLHLLLLLPLLGHQLLALALHRRDPLLGRAHTHSEELLAVEQPLHRELRQSEELDQRRLHRALAPLAPLALQAAEGDRADVLLQRVHVQLAHHQVHVQGADAPPVHAFPARAEFEGEDGGGTAGWSHGCGSSSWSRGLTERGIEEGWDPC